MRILSAVNGNFFLFRFFQLYQKCGQIDRAISILEDHIKEHPTEADLSIIDLLATIQMGNREHSRALQLIERARLTYCSGKEFPLHLTVKAVICEAHLGNLEKAEVYFFLV